VYSGQVVVASLYDWSVFILSYGIFGSHEFLFMLCFTLNFNAFFDRPFTGYFVIKATRQAAHVYTFIL
jgi:hypothetical protein